MSAEMAHLSPLIPTMDFKSSEESEEDGIEIIITPMRKQKTSDISVSSCEAAEEFEGFNIKHDSDTDNSSSSVENKLLSAVKDGADRRDSGFIDESGKNKLKQVESVVSLGHEEECDADAADDAEGEEEEEEDNFVIPDQELVKKIVEQVTNLSRRFPEGAVILLMIFFFNS